MTVRDIDLFRHCRCLPRRRRTISATSLSSRQRPLQLDNDYPERPLGDNCCLLACVHLFRFASAPPQTAQLIQDLGNSPNA